MVVVGPLLDRLMHHGHMLKFDGKSWRLKEAAARVAQHATADQSPVRPVAQVGEFAVAIGASGRQPPPTTSTLRRESK